MSDVSDFLSAQKAQGEYDSQGAFTVDFSRAAERLAGFRLPSENHFLLKVMQIASRLGADAVKFKLESFRSSVTFRAPRACGVNDSEAIIGAFMSPLEEQDAVLADLVSALWGCLGPTTEEVCWTFTEGYSGRRIYIKDHRFRIEDFSIQTPLADGEMPCAFALSVLRRKTWRFWLHARRNLEAFHLLHNHCSLSRADVWVDGRPMERAKPSFYTRHRRSATWNLNHRPYDAVLYDLVPEDQGFKLARPSLSQYLVRNRVFNVWASGTRAYNSLQPDGVATPAWMLQLREDGKNLSLRSVPRLLSCKLVLAYDAQEAAEESGFKLTFVRHSVILERVSGVEPNFDLTPWHGCHLILDDDTLGTDLTGFQILEDQRLADLMRDLAPKVEILKSFLNEGRTLLVGLPPPRKP